MAPLEYGGLGGAAVMAGSSAGVMGGWKGLVPPAPSGPVMPDAIQPQAHSLFGLLPQQQQQQQLNNPQSFSPFGAVLPQNLAYGGTPLPPLPASMAVMMMPPAPMPSAPATGSGPWCPPAPSSSVMMVMPQLPFGVSDMPAIPGLFGNVGGGMTAGPIMMMDPNVPFPGVLMGGLGPQPGVGMGGGMVPYGTPSPLNGSLPWPGDSPWPGPADGQWMGGDPFQGGRESTWHGTLDPSSILPPWMDQPGQQLGQGGGGFPGGGLGGSTFPPPPYFPGATQAPPNALGSKKKTAVAPIVEEAPAAQKEEAAPAPAEEAPPPAEEEAPKEEEKVEGE